MATSITLGSASLVLRPKKTPETVPQNQTHRTALNQRQEHQPVKSGMTNRRNYHTNFCVESLRGAKGRLCSAH